ncbi:hypothetical protein BBP40_009949 [Aspergillus hancockii]|nr:hypothetical protein BBP40_009949 [Aspergillus hancockii]
MPSPDHQFTQSLIFPPVTRNMHSFSSLFCAVLLGFARGTPLVRQQTHHPRSQQIQWAPCENNGTLPTECATFPVPLDYTDGASNVTLDLNLTRISASKSPSRGSIFLNFGGPGDNGVAGLDVFGSVIQGATGGYHDIVVVTPRGTGNTLRFSCYATEEERLVTSTIHQPLVGNASDVAYGINTVTSRLFADTCYATQNEPGQYISTAFTARDHMSVVDALGEDGLLRYWGLSYGTILGATLVSMFPGRMDKVLLDAVVNPHEYQVNRYVTPQSPVDSYADSAQSDLEMLSDTDNVFIGFCTECVATPDKCPLARNRTASELEGAIYAFLDNLKYNPILLPIGGMPTVLQYSTVKSQIFRILYSPGTSWIEFSTLLDNLMTGNLTAASEYLTKAFTADGSGMDAEAQFGIKCSDAFRADISPEDLPSFFDERYAISRFGDIADHVTMRCEEWKIAPRERYTGDFKAATKNPVLLIGNTHDPVTPIASARNASAGFANSVVLEHGAYGHGTFGQASLCTSRAIRSYFLDGVLPEPDTKCDIDTTPFTEDNGWKHVLEKLKADNK